jgi:hypothetical protein
MCRTRYRIRTLSHNNDNDDLGTSCTRENTIAAQSAATALSLCQVIISCIHYSEQVPIEYEDPKIDFLLRRVYEGSKSMMIIHVISL